jgi:hypothetical protein
MNVKTAKQLVRKWVEEGVEQWPGLRGAHLVGGITAMPDDAEFPAYKDVDVHLIFADGSPALRQEGPYPHLFEVSYRGLSIEAGLKPVADYRSPETVLGNPEIAYHLTVDSVLHDPSGMLRELRREITPEYPDRRWVIARIEHERRGLERALDMVDFAVNTWGAAGELMIAGYTTTFASAVLDVAKVVPPRMGGRILIPMGETLAAHGRLALFDELLGLFNLRSVTPSHVERLLAEAAEAFDLAVAVRESPSPFQHKLHRHLRPYFVESCRAMLAERHHRAAMHWITPYYLATAGVILADGPEAAKPIFADRLARFLDEFAPRTSDERRARQERLIRFHDEIFALAYDIAACDPRVVD